ncbi:Flp family type IVb pilin [Novosphingobium sp. YJ-S2-02]|uniref:Flp family type IVb pilin n=1 Tax=Novosphingobium aureum TaxID=2792964 RepID=A0A931HBT4_9SPHN|nr:Flp family type IVb pilin [Novosphingobium aureum]MBH0112566.1 Flp family type IVb pilin [Novosphingobium aureum]
MTKFLNAFFADEAGASAAEYALILAVVGAGIGAAAFALGGAISTSMTEATTCIGDVETC